MLYPETQLRSGSILAVVLDPSKNLIVIEKECLADVPMRNLMRVDEIIDAALLERPKLALRLSEPLQKMRKD
jgi:hypothetical protein